MPGIGIVGAGVAGLHLGLFLLQHGVSATIYTDRGPDEVRAGRLLNTVTLSGRTRARDRIMGVNHWDGPGHDLLGIDIYIAGEPPLAFRGTTDDPFIFLDMRMYLPRLLEEFAARGGKVVRAALDADGVARLAPEHDLMIVATGRAGLCDMFPRVAEHSPFSRPQRTLFAGLFRGIRPSVDPYVAFQVVPGDGEIFEYQFLTPEGLVRAMLIEGIPGGNIDAVTSKRYEDDPARFIKNLYELLQAYAPLVRDRIDRDAFDAIRPLDTLNGALTPVVRRHYITLPNGRLAVALGDTLITHDPGTAQGANAASQGAWLFGELLVERLQQRGALDEEFCAYTEKRVWEALQPASSFSNAQLLPLPPHVLSMYVAAAQSQPVADALITNFSRPELMWAAMSSPEGAERFLASAA
jgi:hypothetical protein